VPLDASAQKLSLPRPTSPISAPKAQRTKRPEHPQRNGNSLGTLPEDWNRTLATFAGRRSEVRRCGGESGGNPNAGTGVWRRTVLWLDRQGQTAERRPAIHQQGFVATRQDWEAFREQLHAEALRRGPGQADGALGRRAVERPARRIRVSSSAPASLGVRPGRKLCCAWTPPSTTNAGPCCSRTPTRRSGRKNVMHRLQTTINSSV